MNGRGSRRSGVPLMETKGESQSGVEGDGKDEEGGSVESAALKTAC